MLAIINISWLDLFFFCFILLLPLSINHFLKLALAKEMIIASVRMALQLIAVGLYLEYLFSLNQIGINLLWLVLMLLIGATAIINNSQLPKRPLFTPVTIGLLVGLVPLLLMIFLGLLSLHPLYHAQYLIPLAGMLLGNSLSGNIIALRQFFGSFSDRKEEYEGALLLGATPRQACLPFMQDAIKHAIAPSLASMTTTGLVTLPGMMTGQILAGTDPLIAIKYQLIILVAIFVMIMLSVTVTLVLAANKLISRSGLLLIQPQQSLR